MYFVLNGMCSLIGNMTDDGVERLNRFLTFMVWDLFRIRRSLIIKNLQQVYGNEKTAAEIRTIGRWSVYHFLLSLLEFLRSKKVDISSRVTIENRHHIDDALAKGHGAYVLCFHMGNWEAMGSAVTRQIRPAYVIVKKVGSKSVNRFVSDLRISNGFYPLLKSKKGEVFEQIKTHLNQGDIIGFVIDQARPGSPRLEFFGKEAKTNTSFAAIWQKAKAPIVPGYMYRTALGTHTICFEPPVVMQETDSPEADILANSKMFNKIVEGIIRRHPEQYFWMHNRWK